MRNDLVSIIMPCYNAENYIAMSIDSVLAQTYDCWELIISNDNSSDSSKDIILDYMKRDNRIVFIDSKESGGAAEARNKALEIAKGRYIAFLDSDDLWDKDKLFLQIEWMEQNDFAFTYSSYRVITEDSVDKKKNVIAKPSLVYKEYLRNTIIGCLTVIIDKDRVGEFAMPNIRSSQDMALWLLILKKGYIAYGYDQVLASYRVVSNSNSSKKWRAVADVWRVYRDIEKLSVLYSLYNFVGYVYNAIKKRI